MKTDFESALLGSGQLMRRGYAYIAENVGKTVAIITAAVAVLVSFTEIGFSDFSAESVTSGVLMMLIASYIIYFSLEDAGEKLGRGSEEYKAADKEYRATCEAVRADMMADLREFVAEYTERELAYRRSRILTSAGLSQKEYEAYLSGSAASRAERRVYARVGRAKPLALSPALLMSRGHAGAREEVRDPKRGKLIKLILGLVPTTLCTLFTVSVMLQTKDEMTVSTVLEAILKLSCLPIIGLRGYSGGYGYVIEQECDWLRAKTRLLRAFLDRHKSTDTPIKVEA